MNNKTTPLEKMECTVSAIQEKIRKLESKLRKKPEDDCTNTVTGAEGFNRVFHNIPKVRDDQPSKFDLEYEKWLDELNKQAQEE